MNVKMNMKKILTALLLSLAAVTGCKKEDLDLTVTIELESAVTVTVGQTRQLAARMGQCR